MRSSISSRRCVCGLLVALWAIGTPRLDGQRRVDTLFRIDKGGLAAGTTQSNPAFSYASGSIKVVLLYDASDRRDVSTSAWTYSVDYSLTPLGAGTLTLSRSPTEDVYESVALYDLPAATASVSLTLTAKEQAAPQLQASAFRLLVIAETEGGAVFDPASSGSRPNVAVAGATATWPSVSGAVEYDVEWVFVDYYRGQVPSPFAAKTPTRVTVSVPEYGVPLDYPDGTLYIRVRAVGRHVGPTPGRRPGPWSVTRSIVITGASRLEPAKNWLHQIMYAEEGKRSRSVVYYDGLLRERQRIDASEADTIALVAETKYDFESRPVMSILPAPRAGTALSHAANFNRDANGSSLGPEDYAAGQGSPGPLSASSGAGRYYSAVNNLAGPHDAFIPQANGYPFSLAEYTRDNTGRIRRASGLGESLRLGADHDNQFLYGTTSATELQRMFGSQVGRANHYRRNVARDQNALGTVAYVDDKDRTIATALVGASPSALVPLPSNATGSGTFSLNDDNEVDRVIGESRSVSRIVNEEPNRQYRFDYDFTGVDYGIGFDPQQPPYCATCSYELTIQVTGPYGAAIELVDQASPSVPTSIIRRVFQNPSPPATCSANQATPHPVNTVHFDATFSQLGEYVVTKLLRLTDGSVDLLVANLLGQLRGPLYGLLLQSELDDVDPSWCAESCEEHCSAATADPQLRAECVSGCEALVSGSLRDMEEAQCRNYEQALAADVSPGGWLFDDESWLDTAAGGETFGGQPYPGSPDALRDMPWDAAWAEQLKDSHTEACHLDVCVLLIPSDTFDAAMALVDTYQKALAGGWLNPLGMTASPRGPPTSTSMRDPYFTWGAAAGGLGNGQNGHLNLMRDTLTGFVRASDGSVIQTLWEFVADPQAVYEPNTQQTSVPPDEQWRLFRSIYLGLKQQVHVHVMEDHRQCKYLDDPHAHFQKPANFATVDELLDAQTAVVEEYCTAADGGLCPVQASMWRQQLEASCALTDATADQVEHLLADYCGEVCGVGNPLGLLTHEALAEGDPILTQVQSLISPCDLGAIATDDPFEYSESCRQDCAATLVPHACVDSLLRAIARRGPFSVGVDVRLDTSDLRREVPQCFVGGAGLPGGLWISDSVHTLPWPRRESGACTVTFYDSTGRRVAVSEVVRFGRSEYAATYPTRITEPRREDFTHVVVQVATRLERDSVSLYVFSTCDVPTVDVAFECSVAEAPGRCAEEAFDLLNHHLRDALAASPVDVRNESTCFEALSAERAVAAFVTRGRLPGFPCVASPCQISLFTSEGRRIDLRRVRSFGDIEASGSYPGPFKRDPIYGLPFAEIAVDVVLVTDKKDGLAVKAYVFSNCPFGRGPACTPAPTGVDWPAGEPPPPDSTCENDVEEAAESYTIDRVGGILGDLGITTRTVHANRCFDFPFNEDLRYTATAREYHYTLFYYDQADNLVQTVPPAGVDRPWVSGPDPDHLLTSRFRYNSLNQVLADSTPDGGRTLFWRNRAMQLRLSQNADQAAGTYSFTRYDRQNRVVMTGVVSGLSGVITSLLADSIDKVDFPDPAGSILSELTRTVYDVAAPAAVCPGFADQQHLRGRVSATYVESQPGTITSASCYSYDPHGNVSALVQVITGLGPKRIDYDYDLVSGKVNAIHYQRGRPDQMLYRFEYDADNRLVAVYTSTDGIIWTRDARYEYYKHGPLARLELGEPVLQGMDYVYTIQGWLKGVNSNTLDPSRDPGRDGDATGASNPRRYTPRDAFGFTLGYYPADYMAAGLGAPAFEAQTQASGLAAAGPGLYDGNIAHMVTAIGPFMANGASPLGVAYRHDQLNRLDTARAFMDAAVRTNAWGPGGTDDYLTAIAYDPNGNIRWLIRNARAVAPGAIGMDSLTYRYDTLPNGRLRSNRLLHINDAVALASHSDDLDDQGGFQLASLATHNYAYTARGVLSRDRAAGIGSIGWSAQGMVVAIDKSAGPDLEFRYDASQRRAVKVIAPAGGAPDYVYYVRDAQGSALATYRQRSVPLPDGGVGQETVLQDVTLSGLGRLGILERNLVIGTAPTGAGPAVRIAGQRRYELSDHLGNVRAVITDRRVGVDADGDSQAEAYDASVLSAVDYFPFGWPIPGRFSDASPAYRFGFNGQERDDEVGGAGKSYDFGARMYNAAVGRFVSIDPRTNDYPQYAPYLFAGNKPVWATDALGMQECEADRCRAGEDVHTPPDRIREVAKREITKREEEAQMSLGPAARQSVYETVEEELLNQDVWANVGDVYRVLPMRELVKIRASERVRLEALNQTVTSDPLLQEYGSYVERYLGERVFAEVRGAGTDLTRRELIRARARERIGAFEEEAQASQDIFSTLLNVFFPRGEGLVLRTEVGELVEQLPPRSSKRMTVPGQVPRGGGRR